METTPKYPSQEYFNRISEVVEMAYQKALENPYQAKQEAHESLKRMGLLGENGKVKRDIVTQERIKYETNNF